MTNMVRELTSLQEEERRAREDLLMKHEKSEMHIKRLLIEKEDLLTKLEVAEGTLEETKLGYEEHLAMLNKLYFSIGFERFEIKFCLCKLDE